MNIDRKQTLERRAIAQRAMDDLDLRPEVRAQARKVYHLATVVLGMKDAEERAQEARRHPSR